MDKSERRSQALEKLKSFGLKLPADWKFDRDEANVRSDARISASLLYPRRPVRACVADADNTDDLGRIVHSEAHDRFF